jgi:hypothetical protein
MNDLLADWEDSEPYLEAIRWFGPDAVTDMTYWGRWDVWTLDEAVSLSLGFDPRVVNWQTVEPSDLALRGIYARRREMVFDAALDDPLPAGDVLVWGAARKLFSRRVRSQLLQIMSVRAAVVSRIGHQAPGVDNHPNKLTEAGDISPVELHRAGESSQKRTGIKKNWRALKKILNALLMKAAIKPDGQESERRAELIRADVIATLDVDLPLHEVQDILKGDSDGANAVNMRGLQMMTFSVATRRHGYMWEAEGRMPRNVFLKALAGKVGMSRDTTANHLRDAGREAMKARPNPNSRS